jgi:uncharacterized membrane protein YgcG
MEKTLRFIWLKAKENREVCCFPLLFSMFRNHHYSVCSGKERDYERLEAVILFSKKVNAMFKVRSGGGEGPRGGGRGGKGAGGEEGGGRGGDGGGKGLPKLLFRRSFP